MPFTHLSTSQDAASCTSDGQSCYLGTSGIDFQKITHFTLVTYAPLLFLWFILSIYEASSLIRATSGQVKAGILNYIQQRTHTIRLQTLHKFQEILRVSAPTRHHQGVSNVKEYQHHTSGKNNDNFFFLLALQPIVGLYFAAL